MGASALWLTLASAGCKNKACLLWTDADRQAYGSASSSAASSGGAGGGGGASGAGGASSGTGTALAECPDRALAKKLLGTPSCAESIESIDSGGELDGDTCCYEVTTKSTACPSEGGQ